MPEPRAQRPGSEPAADAGPDPYESPPPVGEEAAGIDAGDLSADELADAERTLAQALGDQPGATGSGPNLVAERDEYRDALLRIKADFENYKKRVAKDQAATVERAAERLVADLLPVLDACEAAIGHGAADVEPIHKSLLDVLEKAGLTRVNPEGQAFDPNVHEAVMHEPGDDDTPETVVVANLRTGYLWNGRVVRPAMVKVKG
jgi:molecular chaperone GrpE